jgi:hypothetical protein
MTPDTTSAIDKQSHRPVAQVAFVIGIVASIFNSACASHRGADEQAWVDFATISQSVSRSGAAPGESPVGWRLWWTADEIYDGAGPTKPSLEKHGGLATSFRPLKCEYETEVANPGVMTADGQPQCEAIFINEAASNFIFERELWNRNKLIEAAKEGKVHFPADKKVSRQIKTEWRRVQSQRAAKYIVAAASDGQLYGLVAIHLMSHELPDWLWATWLHEDFAFMMPPAIGFHDAFGAKADGASSPALTSLLASHGASRLLHYKLIGTQHDFVDPSALGNPLIEGRDTDTLANSSCMACHRFAAISSNGSMTKPRVSTGFAKLPDGFFPVDFSFSLARRAVCQDAVGCNAAYELH